MNASHIELAVAEHFGWLQNLIIPNIYRGLGLNYEADMVILRPSGYAVEVEIKVTKSDIKADRKKKHKHDSCLFRQLWFAVPKELVDCFDIPLRAGVLAVTNEHYGTRDYLRCYTHRAAKLNKSATKFTDMQRSELQRLGCMRIWTLKKKLLNRKKERDENTRKD